jgi:death-on-curing family protein
MIHDEVVANTLWPGSEPVSKDEYRDTGLLDSAVNRPFQAFGGAEVHRSIYAKAAALFHSLTCNHCFYNGNKRTALVALDLFLTANSVSLLADNESVYQLAVATASHNERGVSANQALADVLAFIQDNAVSFQGLKRYLSEKDTENIRRYYLVARQMRKDIRSHPLNKIEQADSP